MCFGSLLPVLDHQMRFSHCLLRLNIETRRADIFFPPNLSLKLGASKEDVECVIDPVDDLVGVIFERILSECDVRQVEFDGTNFLVVGCRAKVRFFRFNNWRILLMRKRAWPSSEDYRQRVPQNRRNHSKSPNCHWGIS